MTGGAIVPTQGRGQINLRLALRANIQRPHPKVILNRQNGDYVTLPLGPVGGRLGGWARRWAEVPRWGRKPLLADAGPSLRTSAYTITVANPDGTSILGVLKILRAFAETKAGAITITGIGELEAGTYRLRGCDVDIKRREHGTNNPVIATVDIEFVELAKVTLRIGRSGRVVR